MSRISDKYKYDLSAVPAMPCQNCKQPIGQERFLENHIIARFGSIGFIHERCDTSNGKDYFLPKSQEIQDAK